MSNLFTRGLRPLLVAASIALLAPVGLLSPASVDAQPVARSANATATATPSALLPGDVAEAIAGYTQADPDGVKLVLLKLGSAASVLPDDFNQLSPLEQLRWAYGAAEVSAKGAGRSFLAAFVERVAIDTPSIRNDSTVAKFLAGQPAPQQTFELTKPQSDVSAVSPSRDVQRVIAIVSDVVSSRSSGVSAIGIMRKQLKLNPDEVLESVIKFGTARAALADKLARLPNPPQKQELAEIALEIMKTIPAARRNPTLGEAVFRWLGLHHPVYGQWFQMRDEVDRVQQGAMRIPDEKQADAKAVATLMRTDFARMPGLFLDRYSDLRPADVERMFHEYSQKTPQVAALWGFLVISLKSDIDMERYLAADAARLRERTLESEFEHVTKVLREQTGRSLTASESVKVRQIVEDKVGNSKDWAGMVREHGPKPYHGIVEYSRLNNFGSDEVVREYARSVEVNRWVGRLCPAG